MYIVYILEDNNGKQYIGLTNDIKRRLSEHLRGKTQTTRNMKELKILYTEDFQTFEEARKRELYLKSAAGRRFRKKLKDTGV